MTIIVFMAVVVLFAGPGVRDGILRMLRAEHEVIARRVLVEKAARNVSTAVRNSARHAINQRREIDQLEFELDRAEKEVARLKELRDSIEHVSKRRRWIVEGSVRGMAGRYDFIVTSEDPSHSFGRGGLPDWNVDMWKQGRLVSIYGLSRDDAYRRVFARWPEQAGFTIRDAIPSDFD